MRRTVDSSSRWPVLPAHDRVAFLAVLKCGIRPQILDTLDGKHPTYQLNHTVFK